ncbi:hypothetical protein EJ08DRAFT_109494 [Tothia fuscella]|uniref:Uncharacterized protein n=1 Tax=Tothia fuscella TaxID=1048955 RepID=A0A9P4NWJ8_9PEZI|nr:hypothetical protein EJ08DRAFT_109494 [Tothia fuscella]
MTSIADLCGHHTSLPWFRAVASSSKLYSFQICFLHDYYSACIGAESSVVYGPCQRKQRLGSMNTPIHDMSRGNPRTTCWTGGKQHQASTALENQPGTRFTADLARVSFASKPLKTSVWCISRLHPSILISSIIRIFQRFHSLLLPILLFTAVQLISFSPLSFKSIP